MKTETVQTIRGTIEYTEHGRGIPILVLHGGHSNCREFISLRGLDLETFRIFISSRPSGFTDTRLCPIGDLASTGRRGE